MHVKVLSEVFLNLELLHSGYLVAIAYTEFSVYPIPIRYYGDNEIRTRDLLLARQALSQLSYTPKSHGLEWTRTIDLTLIRRAL